MARPNLELLSASAQLPPFRNSGASHERPPGRGISGPADDTVTGLAARIRKENALFVAFLQALHQRDIGEYAVAASLLQEAVSHLRKTAKLLLLARQKLTNDEEWKQWLRTQCLIDHLLADRYMDLVRKR